MAHSSTPARDVRAGPQAGAIRRAGSCGRPRCLSCPPCRPWRPLPRLTWLLDRALPELLLSPWSSWRSALGLSAGRKPSCPSRSCVSPSRPSLSERAVGL